MLFSKMKAAISKYFEKYQFSDNFQSETRSLSYIYIYIYIYIYYRGRDSSVGIVYTSTPLRAFGSVRVTFTFTIRYYIAMIQCVTSKVEFSLSCTLITQWAAASSNV
jgi:hypothetical protein